MSERLLAAAMEMSRDGVASAMAYRAIARPDAGLAGEATDYGTDRSGDDIAAVRIAARAAASREHGRE